MAGTNLVYQKPLFSPKPWYTLNPFSPVVKMFRIFTTGSPESFWKGDMRGKSLFSKRFSPAKKFFVGEGNFLKVSLPRKEEPFFKKVPSLYKKKVLLTQKTGVYVSSLE